MPTNAMFDLDERRSDSPLVKSVWRTTSGSHPGTFTSVAASHLSLVVTHQHGTISLSLHGPETVPSLSPIPEEAEFLGIEFNHGVFLPDLPTSVLVDSPLALPSDSRQSFRLHGSAWQFPDFENADTFIARLVKEGLLLHDHVVAGVLQGRPAAESPRSLQRRFLRSTGLTRGMLLQIERAHEAVRLLESGVSILDTVEKAGYADQPHLTRAMRRFWGFTPAQILNGATLA